MSARLPIIESRIQKITPELAGQYLATMGVNRPWRQRHVDNLANQMIAGEWKLTHQGIAFNCDGSLRDGQHRLRAIIQSGCTIPLMVTTGLDPGAMQVIDTGANRSLVDAMVVDGNDVQSIHVAIGRSMLLRGSDTGSQVTRKQTLEFVAKHIEAIRFAAGSQKMRGITASARSPIARAWYTADRARLADFLVMLRTGLAEGPEDSAAIRVRNMLGENLGAKRLRPTAIYRRTAYGLSRFLSRIPASKLVEPTDELFPIPGDPEWGSE